MATRSQTLTEYDAAEFAGETIDGTVVRTVEDSMVYVSSPGGRIHIVRPEHLFVGSGSGRYRSYFGEFFKELGLREGRTIKLVFDPGTHEVRYALCDPERGWKKHLPA